MTGKNHTPVCAVKDGMGIRMNTIEEMKAQLQAAAVTELPAFIKEHGKDERKSVQNLVAKARRQIEDHEKECVRMERMFVYEKQYAEYSYICGIDEVGRGPLAGPVVAGAVILPKDCHLLYLNDSKQLTAKKREELYPQIMEQAVAVGLGFVSPERIDEINILQATYEAMREAIHKLGVKPDILLNDAVTIPHVTIRQVPIVKGDAKSASIAAASIVAKVTRDRLMAQYDELYPQYGFASNMGYGASAHIDALKKYGPTPIHRRSFIKNFV
jgi:ribonuclease HII